MTRAGRCIGGESNPEASLRSSSSESAGEMMEHHDCVRTIGGSGGGADRAVVPRAKGPGRMNPVTSDFDRTSKAGSCAQTPSSHDRRPLSRAIASNSSLMGPATGKLRCRTTCADIPTSSMIRKSRKSSNDRDAPDVPRSLDTR